MTGKLKTRRSAAYMCIGIFAAITLSLAITTTVIVAISTNRQSRGSRSQPTVSYNLHVSAGDPVMLTAEPSDGDLISVVGAKSASGVPLAIDEFIVENDHHEFVFVSMNDDGTIKSALSSDGLQIDFIWDEHQTVINTTVLINGSQEIFVKFNLSEPVDTNSMSNSNERRPTKRSNRFQPRYIPNKAGKYQRDTQKSDHTDVFVSVESCNGPQSNKAKVYADVLLDYNQESGSYDRKVKFWGTESSKSGVYKVQVPTGLRNSTNFESACDNTNLLLGEVCDVFHRSNSVTQLASGMDVDNLFCSFLKTSILAKFPSINFLSVSHSCEVIFRPFKSICNTGKPSLSCNSVSLVDNGVTREQTIFFTPTTIFPHGKTVQGTGQALSIQPGTNFVPHRFTVNDGGPLRITGFSITPFNPFPKETYVVNVSYNCYSTPMFSAYISVVGTDNFADTQTCYTGPTCTLHVSGSHKSARDNVKITIRNGYARVSMMSVVQF